MRKQALRIAQAFFENRVAYTCPFLYLSKKDRDRINVMLCAVCKTGMGIPNWTKNNHLWALGSHNTVNEIIEARQAAQLWQLLGTTQGQEVLKNANLNPILGITGKTRIAQVITKRIKIPPLPKSMRTRNKARREARAITLQNKFNEKPAAYIDAAHESGATYTIAAADL